MRKDYLKIITTFVILFGIATILMYSFSFQHAYKTIIDFLQFRLEHNHIIGALTFIIIEALSVMLTPFSSVPFTVIAIGLWGKGLTLLYQMLGGLLGASIAYLIGAKAIYPLMKHFIPLQTIDKYRKIVKTKSSFLLIELFFLAMPVEVPGYVLGTAQYHYKKFILAAAMAYLPFYIMTVYAGEAFIQRNIIVLGSFMILFIALFCIAVHAFFKKIEN